MSQKLASVDSTTGLFGPLIQPALDARYMTTFNVKNYGAKGDGVTDDTAAFTAAAAAMVTAGSGILYFGPGTYKVTALPNFVPSVFNGPLTYSVQGAGADVSIIQHYGTTVASSLTASNPLFNAGDAGFGAPVWRGFTIDGANSSGGCSGIIWSDISYGTFHDIVLKNFTTGDGMTFPNYYGWTEGVQILSVRLLKNLNAIRFDVGSGAAVATLSATIASGTAITSLPVAATTVSLYSGQKIILAAATSAPGVTVQTVTTSAAVAVGATSIPIVSATTLVTYTSGTAKVSKGSYGSFDYWTVQGLYVAPSVNQNGIVSEVPRGLGGNIDRLGTTWRMTGNFSNGGASSNSGILLWIKGNDNWDNINWDLSCEVDGGGVGHKSVQHDTTASYLGGIGRFIAYYFTAATGASYQFGITGRVALNGVLDTSGSNILQAIQPFLRNVKGSVAPSSVSGGLVAYPTTAPTSGASYQNLTGKDLFVTVVITATAAGASAGWNVDTYSGLGAGATVFSGVPSGMSFPLTFVHYHGSYAKVTFANATASAPVYRYV